MDKTNANKIIVKPIVTEKTMRLVEKENQYTFSVNKDANKIDVKRAVESLFKVNVLNVRILNTLGKLTRFGRSRTEGKKGDLRKAVVTLKVGDKIDAFEIK